MRRKTIRELPEDPWSFGPPEPPVAAEVQSDPLREEAPPRPPSRMLPCGHVRMYGDEEDAAAREEGHCCAGGKRRHEVAWGSLEGEHVRPIPTKMRRSPERERSGGFPGYCTNEGGYYVGGIGNDCRHAGAGVRCAVHASWGKRG